jgi:ribonuclease J
MANGEHKSLSITAQDTVIISATPVPGNEKSVQGIINSLSKIGCTIFDKSNAVVHVSGHGSQEELKLMLAMTRPTYFMPVHGEAVHLRAHAALAYSMGIPKDHVFVLDNGDTLEMTDGKVRIGQPVDSGIVYVDGLRIGDTDPVVLRDRQKLASDGIVTCVVTLSSRKHKVDEIEFSSRGVSFANDEELISAAQDAIRKSIDGDGLSSGSGTDVIRKQVRNSLSNFLWNKTHTRPMVIPVVMEV